MSEMKKRLQRKGARKGFTLVELLIVIIIIGILAGAMMLVAGTSRDAAEASKIISDLRNMKAAVLMWMADNPTTITKTDWNGKHTDQATLDKLNKYLDRPLIAGAHPFVFIVKEGTYTEGTGTGAQTKNYEVWLLGYKLANVRAGVKDKLASQAASAGLFGGDDNGIGAWPLTASQYYTAGPDKNYIWIVIQ